MTAPSIVERLLTLTVETVSENVTRMTSARALYTVLRGERVEHIVAVRADDTIWCYSHEEPCEGKAAIANHLLSQAVMAEDK